MSRRSKLFVWVWSLIVILACIPLAEAFCRYRHRAERTLALKIVERFHSPFIFTFEPGSLQTVCRTCRTEQFNNHAFRSRGPTQVTQDPGTYRILSYGDSIGFGFAVEKDEAYPQQLESLLNNKAQSNHKVEVVNTARGHAPTVYSFHIREDILRFKPNLVLLEIELINDLGDEAVTRFDKCGEFGLPVSLLSSRYIAANDLRGVLSSIPVGPPELQRFYFASFLEIRLGFFGNLFSPSSIFSKDSGKYIYNLGYDQFLITDKTI